MGTLLLDIGKIGASQPVDDWVMTMLLLTLLLLSLLLGPRWHEFLDFIQFAFGAGGRDAELKSMTLHPVLSISVQIVSVASVSLTIALASADGTPLTVLWSFTVLLVLFLVKQSLIRLAVSMLYARQLAIIRSVRWNSFGVSMLALIGAASVLVNMLAVFASLPGRAVIFSILTLVLIAGIALAIKVKTCLFSRQCNFLGFLLYLCALEFGPVVLAMVILGTNTVIV